MDWHLFHAHLKIYKEMLHICGMIKQNESEFMGFSVKCSSLNGDKDQVEN